MSDSSASTTPSKQLGEAEVTAHEGPYAPTEQSHDVVSVSASEPNSSHVSWLRLSVKFDARMLSTIVELFSEKQTPRELHRSMPH